MLPPAPPDDLDGCPSLSWSLARGTEAGTRHRLRRARAVASTAGVRIAMKIGPLWTTMNARPRRSMAMPKKGDVPEEPGVYALYRDDARMDIGKADRLQDRVWGNHSGRGVVMTGSALRRNIAEYLGFATANEIKKRAYQCTAEEAAAVRAWLDGCEIAWITCKSKAAGEDLEDDSRREYKPPLTKR
jgi:hypothetical protein